MNNNNPLYDLAEMLKNAGIPYELVYNPVTNSDILVYPNEENRVADAIYFYGSYGYKQGLLEVSGKIVEIDDEVEGNVSAVEAFRRIKKLWESGKMTNERLKIGFYGGKFLPFHIGHAYAAIKALESCDVLYLILFHGGEQEEEIQKNKDKYPLLNCFFSPLTRRKQLYDFSDVYNHYYGKEHNKIIIPAEIDISKCRYLNGKEDWSAETPLVISEISISNEILTFRYGIFNQVQPFDYVYSSEPSYNDYFKKAYPFAKHIIIDAERNAVPISATMIRNMDTDLYRKYVFFNKETIDKLIEM